MRGMSSQPRPEHLDRRPAPRACAGLRRLLGAALIAAFGAVGCGGPEPIDPGMTGRDAAVPPDAAGRDGGRDHDASEPVDAALADAAPVDSALADAGSDAGAALSDRAPVFDGTSGYVEIPDDDAFSQPTYGALTVEAWIRPDSLSMPEREGSGYVHFMGKGVGGEHEWVARMYQQGNSEDRDNRISFYSFNLTGGLGAGSYFQDDFDAGTWIHYVGTMDEARTYIFRDGMQRDSDLLSGYDITPGNGTAPVRIGTRDRNSFFEGSIARVAIYGARLANDRIAAHAAAHADGTYDAVVIAEPSLIAFYPLNETEGTIAHDVVGGRDGRYVAGVMIGATRWEP
jgi:hypothetical protein